MSFIIFRANRLLNLAFKSNFNHCRSLPSRVFFFLLIFVFFRPTEAQQSLFNAFSGDRTLEGKHFFQAQSNIIHGNAVLNNTYNYGLSPSWEIGANLFDVPLSKIDDLYQDEEFLLNGQYFLKVLPFLQLSVGAQSGFVSTAQNEKKYAQLLFVNSKWTHIETGARVVLGLLKGNNNFLHSNAPLLQLGLEYPIFKERLHFVTDYISGKTENSVGVIGFTTFMTKHWALSLGYQHPADSRRNSEGVVIEMTYSENE